MGTLRRRFGWGRPGQSTGRSPGRKTGSRPGASIGKTERKRPGRKPLPRPGLHCPLMPADERILSSVLLLTDLCFPKPVKITVCINRLNLVALAYHEFCLGLLARLQFLSLVALCGGKGNPLDIVLRCHGMLCRPTVSVTFCPSTVTTGTCFSTAASVVLATSSCIFSPQHITGTPLLFTYAIILPQ